MYSSPHTPRCCLATGWPLLDMTGLFSAPRDPMGRLDGTRMWICQLLRPSVAVDEGRQNELIRLLQGNFAWRWPALYHTAFSWAVVKISHTVISQTAWVHALPMRLCICSANLKKEHTLDWVSASNLHFLHQAYGPVSLRHKLESRYSRHASLLGMVCLRLGPSTCIWNRLGSRTTGAALDRSLGANNGAIRSLEKRRPRPWQNALHHGDARCRLGGGASSFHR